MDKETKEYLDRRLLVLATKDDVEKLRQETKVNFRQLKEENKSNMIEWRQEIKTDIDQLRKENNEAVDPIREEIKEGIQRMITENQSALDQLKQTIELFLPPLREVERFEERLRPIAEEVAELNGKVKEGFTEVKEELGSMIKFSYADIEKKIHALEARIKALEKMVFP